MKKILLLVFVLSFLAYTKPYKGAEYRTKETFLYGRFEVRLKTPQKDGMLASFFTYHEGTGINTWNEIDIEILGRYSNSVQFNTITPGQINHERHQNVKFNPAEDYHVYAFEWTPTYVAWFVDGEEVYRQTGEHITTLNKAQKLMMNIWNPTYTNWVGKWNADILPAFAFYDFVSVYTYTPGLGNYGTSNNFTLKWKDEFDSWNQTRWDKATHTWDGNNCDFVHANAVFNNGNLILCLTDEVNLGYQDKKAPNVLWARISSDNKNKVFLNFTEILDSVSAVTNSNYIIPGQTLTSATLESNKKTVALTYSNLDTASITSIIVTGIKDLFNNTISSRSVNIIKPNPLKFPVKINTGGPAVLTYLGDKEFSENVEYGFINGNYGSFANTLPINGTEDDAVFRDELANVALYKVRCPNGRYRIRLYFSENWFKVENKRVFDIFIENKLQVNNLDIYKSSGSNMAYMLFRDVDIYDEVIDIHFASEIDYAKVDAIMIEQLSLGVEDESLLGEMNFELFQNYPNPFNGTTVIPYYINKPEEIKFEIHNLLGEKIYSENLGFKQPGGYRIIWSGTGRKSSGSGIYFYTLSSNKYQISKKLILLK